MDGRVAASFFFVYDLFCRMAHSKWKRYLRYYLHFFFSIQLALLYLRHISSIEFNNAFKYMLMFVMCIYII